MSCSVVWPLNVGQYLTKMMQMLLLYLSPPMLNHTYIVQDALFNIGIQKAINRTDYHCNSPLTPFSGSFCWTGGGGSAKPRFLNSSLAIRFLNVVR